MGDNISDQELRRRLLSFNTVVPPVTGSTRKLLLKKLAKLESNKSDEKPTSKSMPPPKPKTPSNGTNESIMISSSMNGRKQSQHLTFNIDSPRKSTRLRRQVLDAYDTSDSEVDASSLGRSILPANPYISSSSPKSNETSLMNVSTKAYVDEDQNSYSSPETKKTPTKRSKRATKLDDIKVNKTIAEPTTQKLRSSSQMSSTANKAIKRWQEKLMNESQNKNHASNTSRFGLSSFIPKVSLPNLRKNNQFPQLSSRGNNVTTQILILLIGFFAVVFGLYFVSIQSSTSVLPSGILNSLCAKKNLQGYKCDEEQEKVQRIFNSIVSLVQDKYIKNKCDKPDVEPTVHAQIVYDYIFTHEKIQAKEIEDIVELFKIIAKTYSDSPIGFNTFDTSFHINVQPNLPVMCTVKNIFSNMFYLITWIGIGIFCILK